MIDVGYEASARIIRKLQPNLDPQRESHVAETPDKDPKGILPGSARLRARNTARLDAAVFGAVRPTLILPRQS